MSATRPQQIELIPISRITVLNPRARNKRQHREIVNNIEAIGLKRPMMARVARAMIWSAERAASRLSKCSASRKFLRW